MFVTGNADITGTSGDGVQTLSHNGTNTVDIIAGTTSSNGNGNGVNAQTDACGNGKIQARKRTSADAMEQRMLARAIKRARYIGLLPYVAATA